MAAVTLVVVPNDAEADIIRGLLGSNGIESWHRGTQFTEGVWPMGATSPIEVLVDEKDLEQARKLLESS